MNDPAASGAVPRLIDCHSDIMIDVFPRRERGERAVIDSRHRPRFEAGGIGAVVVTVGGDASSLSPLGLDRVGGRESVLAMSAALRAEAEESEGRVEVATSADAVADALSRDVLALVPAIEGGFPFADEIDRVAEFYEQGVRMISMTWNARTALAIGTGAGDGGLTPLGKEAVAEMNRLGVIVDVSHLNDESFWDVAENAEAPIMASHSNARALCEHERNLTDEQLDAIAAADGLVAVVLFPGFVGSRPLGVDDVVDHIVYIAEQIGVDKVAIGSDFVDFALDVMAADMAKHPGLYTEEDLIFPDGVRDCTTLSVLLHGLRARGFTDNELRKVASDNFISLFRAVERAAD